MKRIQLGRRGGNQPSGFTLIELLIVIAIILILISIALPNFLEAQERARVARAKGNLRSIATAGLEHFTQYGFLYSDYNDQIELRVSTRNKNGSLVAPCPTDAPDPTSTGGLTFIVGQKANYGLNLHCPLTTPIKFIDAAAFHDPWSDGTIPIGYDSRRSTTVGADTKIIRFGTYSSSGPDRIAGHWYRAYPGNTTGKGLLYNPTNGTKSEGDLWQIVVLDTTFAKQEFDQLNNL
jgi:prepilin-type N-terminal cleavage/methylation domain-containing protein